MLESNSRKSTMLIGGLGVLLLPLSVKKHSSGDEDIYPDVKLYVIILYRGHSKLCFLMRTCGKISFKQNNSEAAKEFMLLFCRAEALAKGMFFHRHRHQWYYYRHENYCPSVLPYVWLMHILSENRAVARFATSRPPFCMAAVEDLHS